MSTQPRALGALLAITTLAACRESEPITSPTRPATPNVALSSMGMTNAVPGEYIVTLRDGARAVASLADESTRRFGGKRRFVFDHTVKNRRVRAYSVEGMSPEAAEALAKEPNVLRVEPNQILVPDGTRTLPFDGATQQLSSRWGLDRIDETSSPTFTGQFNYYYSGSGVHIYIVDSGINCSHTEFTGRIGTSYGLFLVNGLGYVGPCSDQIGHGTAVAGLAAGTRFGAANAATIHSVRIDDTTPGAGCDVVVDRLYWIIANVELPAVVNMSYGAIPNCFSVEDAVADVLASGITMVKSAGNDNADAFGDRANRPANLIVVGSTDRTDTRASTSNFGSTLALFAPGVSQMTASTTSTTDTAFFSGTSGASPIVAGAAAALLEHYTTYTGANVRSMLVGNSTQGVVSSAGTGSPNKLLYSYLQ